MESGRGFKRSTWRSILFYVGCVITLGLLWVVTQWQREWQVLLTHSQCPLHEADIILHEIKKSGEMTTVPGLRPRDAKSGNNKDIESFGGLHLFLVDLHKKYGPIVSFYYGQRLTVSICTPELFKQQRKVFNRPVWLNKLFEPILGEASIQYANGEEGKTRHAAYRRCFSDAKVANFFSLFQEFADDVVQKWQSLPDQEHINLREHVSHYAARALLRTAFGSYFDSDSKLEAVIQSDEYCWGVMERQLQGTDLREDSEEYQRYVQHKDLLRGLVLEASVFRRQNGESPDGPGPLFMDAVEELDMTEDKKNSDLITMLVAGFHSTGLLLTWAIYYVAREKLVQNRLHKEIIELIGDGNLTNEKVNAMTYLQQVVNETLRCSTMSLIANRYQDEDTVLGGYHIPAGTAVIHALGVSLINPEIYPNPSVFDPERFTAERKASRPPLSFEPFGFAGQRKCPGYKLSLAETKVLLVTLLSKFQIDLVPGQKVSKVYGLVTAPDTDIWVTISPRM